MTIDETTARTAKTPPLASTQDSAAPTARVVAKHCAASTKAGLPCRGTPLPGSDFCIYHDPARRDALVAAARKGGENRARQPAVFKGAGNVKFESADEVRALLADTVNRLRRGEIDTKTANAVGFLANIARPVIDAVEFEKRLKALEAEQAVGKHGRGKAK